MSKNTERPSWDELFIATAVLGSSRGTCDRLRTSCVLVKNKKIVGSGYNGSIANTPTCDETEHDMLDNHCVRTLHGEVNALANSWGDLHGATAYIVATPCLSCVKDLAQHGISRIVYVGHYDTKDGGRVPGYCKQAKIELVQFAKDPKKIATVFSKIFSRLNGSGGVFKDFNVNLGPIDPLNDKMKTPCGEKK